MAVASGKIFYVVQTLFDCELVTLIRVSSTVGRPKLG